MSWEPYIGIPWCTGGRARVDGLDCWGLLRYFYGQEFAIKISEHAAELGHLADRGQVAQAELTSPLWIPCINPTSGDAVALGRHDVFSHVGVYAIIDGYPWVLHVKRNAMSCLQTLRDLKENGFPVAKFYRHANRPFHS